jgi:hypothetical protein
MKGTILKRSILIGIILILIGTSSIPAITGYFKPLDNQRANQIIQTRSTDTELFYPTDDTYLTVGLPDLNSGSDTNLKVRNTYGYMVDDWGVDMLIKFDLSSVAPTTVIDSATLYLQFHRWKSNNPAGRQLTFYRILSDWDESTVTYATRPTTNALSTAVCSVPSGTNQWMACDVTTDVQAFVNGEITNYGWKIMDDNFWGGPDIPLMYFYSKEYGDYTPYLEIETLEFTSTLIIGRITNLTTQDNYLTFEAVSVRCMTVLPFSFNTYYSGEQITISPDYMGLVTPRFIIAFCGAAT